MQAPPTELEVRSDRRGKIAAVIAGVLLIVLMLVNIFSYQNPPPGQPGILVNLGFIDQGQGEDRGAPPASAPDPQPPLPDPTPQPPAPAPAPPPPTPEPTPQPRERDVIQQEDPAEIALRRAEAEREARRRAEADQRRREQQAEDNRRAEERRRADAARAAQEREARERAEAERRAQEAAEAERRRQAAEAQALKDQLGGGLSSGGGRGNTGTAGSQGDPDGDPDASRIRGGGRGDDRVSGGLGGRGVLSSPAIRDKAQEEGTVVVEACVNASGVVTSAKFVLNASSTSSPTLVQRALANARQWRFSAGTADLQCGRITYRFDLQ